jgi:hypothetical protein
MEEKNMRKIKITQTMKECYITINHEAMREAEYMGVVENLGENRRGTNKYIGLNGTNTCLVRVTQNSDYGVYCVINKQIQRTDGKIVNLVDKLRQFSFHTQLREKKGEGKRYRTRTSTNDLVRKLGYHISSVDIEKIIHTLRTGKIIIKQSNWQTHHEISVFDHRVEVCWLLPKEMHREIHRRVGQYSRKNGDVIENINNFAWLYNKLKKIELYGHEG